MKKEYNKRSRGEYIKWFFWLWLCLVVSINYVVVDGVSNSNSNTISIQDLGNSYQMISGNLSITITKSDPSLEITNIQNQVMMRMPWIGYSDWYAYDFQSINHQIYEGYEFRTGTDIQTYTAIQILQYTLSNDRTSVSFVTSTDENTEAMLTLTFNRFEESNFNLELRVDKTNIESKHLHTHVVVAIAPTDFIYGFGARYNNINQNGNRLYCWCEDGGWDMTNLYVNFEADLRLPKLNDVSTYFPMPWFFSDQGYGLWVNTTFQTHFDIGKSFQQQLIIEQEMNEFEDELGSNSTTTMVIFLQKTPSAMIKKFVSLSSNDGNTALVPPLWGFGPWNEFGNEFNDSTGNAVLEIQRYIDMDIPISVHLGNLHFFPLGDQVGHEAYYQQMNQQINGLGVQVLAYFNSMIDTNYTSLFNYALNHSYFVVNPTRNNSDGYEPYLFQYKGAGPNPFYCGVLDFTNKDAYVWYQEQLNGAIQMGFSGFMYDYGEYIDPKAWFGGNGKYGKEMHNRYPVIYQQCAHDYFISITNSSDVNGINAPNYIFYARSGYVGSQSTLWFQWTGDPTCDFDSVSGLPAHLKASINLGLSGVPFSGSNIPGFVWYKPPDLELWSRWIEVGAFSGSMQDDTGGTPLGPYPKSHVNDWPEGTDCWRKFAKLRFQLVYYIYTSAYECHDNALGMMRHFIADDKIFNSKDFYAFEQEYEYLFGDKFLVAPVVAAGATSWEVYLPLAYNWYQLEGVWIYNDTDGRFRLVSGDIIKGGTTMLVETPLEILPLFIKVGTIIPVMDPSVQTLNQPTNASAGIISYYDRINILHLWCFPTEQFQASGYLWDGTSFEMYQDTSNNLQPRLDINNLQPPRDIVIAQVAQLNPVVQVANGQNPQQKLMEVKSWQDVVQINGTESVWAWDVDTQVLYVKLINISSVIMYS